MFSLKTNKSQLRSVNSNLGEFNYRQLPPSETATHDSFSKSEIVFRWQTSGVRWVDLRRSFLRMRLQVRRGDGSLAGIGDDVALSMNCVANMFQSCEFRIAETTVSKMGNNVGQCDALKTRSLRNRGWMDSIGASAEMTQSSFYDRQGVLTSVIKADVPFVDGPAQPANAASGKRPFWPHFGTNQIETLNVATPAQNIRFTANGGVAIPDIRGLYSVGQRVYINDGAEKVALITKTFFDGVSVSGAALTASGPGNVADQFRVSLKEPLESELSRGAPAIELMWQPPLAIFDIPHALPAGRFELVLLPKPDTQWMSAALESLVADKAVRIDAGGAAAEMYLDVESIYLDLAEVRGPRVDNLTFVMDLSEVKCHKSTIADGSTSDEIEVAVPQSTVGLTLAFQDSRAGRNTLYSQSKFKLAGDSELKLQRFYLEYAQQKRPRIDAAPRFRTSTTNPLEDYTVARYIDSMVQTGGYARKGGCETVEEWHERGPYYHFSWPKEGTDLSTHVLASYQFSEGVSSAVALIFAHYRAVATVKVEDGRVIEVLVKDA